MYKLTHVLWTIKHGAFNIELMHWGYISPPKYEEFGIWCDHSSQLFVIE